MHKNDKCTHLSCIKKSMSNTKKQRLLKSQRRQNFRKKCVKFAAKPIMCTSLDDSIVKEDDLMNEEDDLAKTNQWETIVLNYLNRLKGLCGLWRRNDDNNTNNDDNNVVNNNVIDARNTNFSNTFNFQLPRDNSFDEISINDDNHSYITPRHTNPGDKQLFQHVYNASYNANNDSEINSINNENLIDESSQQPLLQSHSTAEVEIGKERAIKIVKSAIEYGLASGVLQQNGIDFTFSNEVKNYLQTHSLSLDTIKASNALSNSIPLSKNYKLARTLHPKSCCFRYAGVISKAIQCTPTKIDDTSIDNIINELDNNIDDKLKQSIAAPLPMNDKAPTMKRGPVRQRHTIFDNITTGNTNDIDVKNKNSEDIFRSFSKIISKTNNRRQLRINQAKKIKFI